MEACFGLPVRGSCCPLTSPGTGRWRPVLGVRSGGLVAPWRVPERDDGGLLWASGQGVLLPPDESRKGTMEARSGLLVRGSCCPLASPGKGRWRSALGFRSGGLVAPWRVPERDDGGLLWASGQGVLLPPGESRKGTMEVCFGLPVRGSCCPLASPGKGRWRSALGVRSGGLVAPWRVPERDDGGLLWGSGQGVLLPPGESRKGTMEACFGLPVRGSCCPLTSPGTGRWRLALGFRSGGLVAPWRVPRITDSEDTP